MQNATDLRKTLTQEAKAILSGSNESPAQIYDLAKRLAALSEFEFARRVLEKAYEKLSGDDAPVLRLRIVQKWALYTYKDTKLNREERFETARKILIKEGAISQTTDQETLGLAGAIYKRRWEVNSQKRDLEWALYYYSKGHQQGPEKDQGYTGINAAFVEDLLAHQEQREAREVGGESETAPERQARARAIRQEIIEHVVPLEAAFDPAKTADWWWWVYATVGEAYFGLGEYVRAVEWLVHRPRAAGLDISPWMRESTERHLAALAVMQTDAATEAEFVQSPAGVALTKLFGSPYTVGLIYLQREDAVRVGFERRFGLGLSGGGFRASLFHIGVLARLAELDLLRGVEVFSCVSGGSIIGAHYYLALRELLESRSDSDITQEDYLRLVKNIEEKFVEGVQQNIRTRALAELLTNLQRVLFSGYSRTRRVGELYEREIFSRIGNDEKERKRRKRQKLWMSELRIHPMNEEGQQAADFDWRYNNWLRRNKVPALVINAATLNTGHSWHFTPFEMGEPPPMWESNIETNYYLPVIKYEDAPERFPRVRLGHAVAASSCVPGLFEPLVLDNLYEGKSVLLVDGGVCDNQGIQGLLQNNCDVILVSDGSGQTGALDVPGSGVVGVLGRSAGISQARVREAQYYDLKARKRSSILREFLFLHLKEGLDAAEVNVVGWPQRSRDEDERMTGYGVARDVQELLAGVRTDLDSFCDAEAYALMASAYRMTERALSDSEFFRGRAGTEKRVQWKFLDIEDNMRVGGKKKEKLKVLLKASASRTFRFWKMTKPTKYAGILLAFALLAGAVVASRYLPWRSVFPAWSGSRLNTRELVWAVALLLGLILLRFIIGELYQPAQIWFKRQRQSILYRLIGVILLCGGFLIARLHLWTFDKLFLALGRLKRFKS